MVTLRRSEYEFSAKEEFQDGETVWDFAERLKNRVAPDGSIEGIHVEANFVDVTSHGEPPGSRSIPSHGRWVLQVVEQVEDR